MFFNGNNTKRNDEAVCGQSKKHQHSGIYGGNKENKEMLWDVKNELDVELGYEKSKCFSKNDADGLSKNYCNGYSQKTVKTQLDKGGVKVLLIG